MPDVAEARAAIEAHRVEIDEIDRQLVALLNERAGLSLAIRALKPYAGMQLYDAAREEAIFQRVTSYSDGVLADAGLREVYETLLKVMKENPAPASARE